MPDNSHSPAQHSRQETVGGPADLFERVARALGVAYAEWMPGEDRIQSSPALATLFDLDPGDWTVQRLLDHIHPDDLAGYKAALTAFMKSGADRTEISHRFRRRDGGIRWCLNHYYAERDPSGRVTRLTTTSTDITKEKEHEAANRVLLARQAASVEVLKAIAASPDDPQPAFELIARRARALCDAAAVSIVEYDGALMHLRTIEGFDTAAIERYRLAFPRAAGPDTFQGRTLQTNDIVHVLDYDAEPALFQAGRDLGTMSSLFVPLRRDGKAIGVLGLARFETGGFDDAQIVLVESFAEQASLAIAGAATLRELRARTAELDARNSEYGERIEQQSATIDVLKAMSASPGDPQPVFDLIVERARTFCEADSATLARLDGETLHLQASSGMSDEEAHTYEASFPRPVSPSSAFGRTILARETVQIPDVLADPEHFSRRLAASEVRSIVGVPLLRAGSPIGAIALGRKTPGAFSATQVELLQTFAEQAVIAIGSAETYRALQTRTADLQESLEYQTATSDVLKVISRSTFDLQPVLDTVAETAARLCDADQANIVRVDDGMLRLVANFGFPSAYEAAIKANGAVLVGPNRPNVLDRCVLEGHTVHIHDVAAVPGYGRVAVELGKQRTSLGVPLQRDGEVIGVIILARQRVEPFTERQIELVSTFADQAVIAIENTRLLTEQQEALEQQTATAEVLGVINRSPGDLAPVFDAILEKAHTLLGASIGTLWTYDGEYVRGVATHGHPDDVADNILHQPERPGANARRLIDGERYVQISDLRAIEQRRPGISSLLVERTEVRTNLAVPLRKDGRFVGIITAFRTEVRPFAEKEIALLENFAAQAVIAMENARLLGELRDRTAELAERNDAFAERIDHQAATIDVLKAMSASPGDPQPVFDLIVSRARDLCNGASVGLLEFDGELVYPRASSGGDLAAIARFNAMFPMPPNRESIAGRAILDRQVVHIRDMDAEPGLLQAVRDMGGKSTLSLPLLRDGRAIGGISINITEPGGFSDSQVELMKTFAEQAVIAIGSAETYRALRDRTAALAERNSEYGEQIEHQSTTIDVLKVMSASPGNAQPVFDLIVRQAAKVCKAPTAVLFTYDGEMLHWRATSGAEAYASGAFEALKRRFPMAAARTSVVGRAVLDKQVIHLRDSDGDPELNQALRDTDMKSFLAVPLLRDGWAMGVIGLSARETGGFTGSQVELLKTFAEQAVIAIGSAETYRALRDRTAALAARNSEYGERIEQQAATIDVLKVMSTSPGDAQPVFELIVERARAVCEGNGAGLALFDGELLHARAVCGFDDTQEREWRGFFPRPAGRDTLFGRAILARDVVHERDMSTDSDYGLRSLARSSTFRAIMSVPMLRGDRPIGAISLTRTKPGDFNESQVALLRTFAEQAVIAVGSAETYRALQERTAALAERNSEFGERIEQQAATIDVLKVMSSTPDDTQPVFDQICRRAQELCNGQFAGLYEFDGELVHLRSFAFGQNEPAAVAQFQALFPRPLTRELLTFQAILDRKPIHVRNLDAESVLNPVLRNLPYKSLLALPLLHNGAAIGAITLNAFDPGGFSDSQIALLQTFAEQAVIAIGSVANFKALRERTAELTRSVAELQALDEVLRAVNSSLDLDTVLATIINRAVRLSQADEGTIYEFDEAEQIFVPKSAHGMTEDRVAALRERRIRLGETHLGRSAVERAPVYVEDVQLDPTLPDPGGLLRGIHAVLAVPLLKGNKVVGGLVIRRRTEGSFASTTVTLMQTFAGQCVLAIENARLFQELASRGDEARSARVAAESALTDLRRTQDRLVQTEKLASLGQLTAGIAHEIKNPLNFVNNFSELSADLLDELRDAVAPGKLDLAPDLRAEIDDITTTLKGNLEKIAHHGKRADSIVKNMLLHSRTGPSEHRPIDVNATVEEALNLAYHGARAENREFNITMEKHLDPKAGSIEAYPQEFIRVMLNLIGNGFYAAHKRASQTADRAFEPTLRLTTRDLGESVEIQVHDNGTGIPEAAREKIFEPFFTTKPAGEGTGLGLSLSHDIVVKQHEGQLTVNSQIDTFTEFTIILPRRMNEGATP